MAGLNARARALQSTALIALPTGLAIVFNAFARPLLAAKLDGVQQQSYTNYRSYDSWWLFDANTQAAHPLLTGFLNLSDGAIAIIGLLSSGLVLGAILLREWRNSHGRISHAD